ncbi:MAG TPA: M14 family zinc carboxypeptidase [Planctomycetota bacterium]|nr:M14 family zinc carboxypeptidase [Planctomycetota bacterium]
MQIRDRMRGTGSYWGNARGRWVSGNVSPTGAAGILGTALVLSGCALEEEAETSGELARETFGASVEKRPIEGRIIGSGDATYLLLGVIHGNEPLGADLLERFAEHAALHPSLLEGKRLVIVPVLNPDGLARGSRTNARGVDLNRNFPARTWRRGPRHGAAPSSEPETRVIQRLIRRFEPERILSVHSPLHCVNFDGPARNLAGAMARAARYPLRASIGYSTPGSLGSYAGGDLEIPNITLELGPKETKERAWRGLRAALEVFVTHPTGAAEPGE